MNSQNHPPLPEMTGKASSIMADDEIFSHRSKDNPHIKVVVVDDHPIVREGVRSILEATADIELVAEGIDGAAVMPLLQEYQPDVLILDLNMPMDSRNKLGMKFPALPIIARIQRQYSAISIIILTSEHIIPVVVDGAIERGVQGYLLKDDDLTLRLAAAIRTVQDGGVSFSEAIKEIILADRPKVSHQLTDRQIEILKKYSQNPDKKYAVHAAELSISLPTFKTHIQNIKEALGAGNITTAIIRGIQLGYIEL